MVRTVQTGKQEDKDLSRGLGDRSARKVEERIKREPYNMKRETGTRGVNAMIECHGLNDVIESDD